MLRYALFLLLLSAFSLSSCAYDSAEQLLESQPPAACDSAAVTYAGSISPLLGRHCRSCHNPVFPTGNVNLDGYAQVKRYADNGLLVGVTSHAPGFAPMPKGAPRLSDCDVSRIRQWVAAGARNN